MMCVELVEREIRKNERYDYNEGDLYNCTALTYEIPKLQKHYKPHDTYQTNRTSISVTALEIADAITETDYVDIDKIVDTYIELSELRYDLLFKTISKNITDNHRIELISLLKEVNDSEIIIPFRRLDKIISFVLSTK